MYLKELTLRGFKSFASATTLRFEPGITAVVGPNGSGKSNIVDALTWVMGEQGAKNLRGTSMEDVIFAGTSSRPPLGRAQVSLTIDNTDHTLNIDYSEVTISRTIFRIRDQRLGLPSARHPGAVERHRARAADARDRRAGAAGRDSEGRSQRPPRVHRRGRGHPQAPQAQGTCAAQVGEHRNEPVAARRPAERDTTAARAAWPAGAYLAQGRQHPGDVARCAEPPVRRRCRRRDGEARRGARRAGFGASRPAGRAIGARPGQGAHRTDRIAERAIQPGTRANQPDLA